MITLIQLVPPTFDKLVLVVVSTCVLYPDGTLHSLSSVCAHTVLNTVSRVEVSF